MYSSCLGSTFKSSVKTQKKATEKREGMVPFFSNLPWDHSLLEELLGFQSIQNPDR